MFSAWLGDLACGHLFVAGEVSSSELEPMTMAAAGFLLLALFSTISISSSDSVSITIGFAGFLVFVFFGTTSASSSESESMVVMRFLLVAFFAIGDSSSSDNLGPRRIDVFAAVGERGANDPVETPMIMGPPSPLGRFEPLALVLGCHIPP